MHNLYGYEVNESTIAGAGEQCYRLLSQTEEMIREKILGEPVLHADETVIRVGRGIQKLPAFSVQHGA